MRGPTGREFELVREMDGELIIVDRRHDMAHRLTHEAAAVWRACDGTRDAALLAAHVGITVSRAEALLGELRALDLLDEPEGQTRRSMLRRAVIGGAVVAGGTAVSSVLVPSAEQAFTSMTPTENGGGTTQPTYQGSSDNPTTGSSLPGTSAPGTRSPGGSSPVTPTVHGQTRTGGGTTVAGAGRRTSPTGRGVTGVRGTRSLPAGSLPFTGFDIARTAFLGGGALAAGAALRRATTAPPPE